MRDRDPIEMLRALADEGHDRAVPKPADEVRLLGARRHRRRVIAVSAAAAVAVAAFAGGAVATAGTVLGTAPEPAAPTPIPTPIPTPEPTPSPSPVLVDDEIDNTAPDGGWLTEVPEGFPIAVAFPDYGGDGQLDGPAEGLDPVGELEACSETAYPTTDPVDRLGAAYSAPEYLQPRELTLYEDAQAAHDALADFVHTYAECAEEDSAPGSTTFNEVEQTGFGDESWLVRQTYATQEMAALGLTQLHVVRVGNALLVVNESSEAGPDDRSIEEAVAEMTGPLDSLGATMCLFAGDPCETDDAAGNDPEPDTIGDETLLAAGEVTYNDATQFVETDPADELSVCQREAGEALGADSMVRRDLLLEPLQGESSGAPPRLQMTAMGFSTPALALRAYETLGAWAEQCTQTVRTKGYDTSSSGPDWATVSVTDAQARFLSLQYGPVPGDEFGELAFFHSEGVALVGSRVLLMSLAVPGQDFNVAYNEQDAEELGMELHPMIRWLPEAANRLSS